MLTVFLRSIIIYLLLALILRLMGKRQVGELEITELVAALLLSELAAMVIDDSEKPLLYSLVPILCILFIEVMLSFAVLKLAARILVDVPDAAKISAISDTVPIPSAQMFSRRLT